MNYLVIFLTILISNQLICQWQETEYGYISKDTLNGELKYDNDFNSLIFEDKERISDFNIDKGIETDISVVIFYPNSFVEKNLPSTKNLIEVEFFNDNVGMILSKTGQIFRTLDGGETWTKSDYNKSFTPTRLRYLSNGDAIISGKKGVLLKSYDFGETWVENTFLDSNINVTDFDCKNPFECFLIERFNAIKFDNNFKELKKIDYRLFNTREEITNEFQSLEFTGEAYVMCGKANQYKENDEYYRNSQFSTVDFESAYNHYYEDIEPIKRNFTFINSVTNRHIITIEDNNKLRIYQKFKSGGPRVGTLIETQNELFKKVFANNEIIAIPTSNGNLYYFDSLYINPSTYNLTYRTDNFKISDTTLFDYYQISQSKGIATSVNGKYYITDFSTSVEYETLNDNFEVFPNPVTDKITIQFKTPTEIKSVQIFDLTGNLLFSEEPYTFHNNYTQSLKTIQAGAYFLKIITNKDIYFRKIIKF